MKVNNLKKFVNFAWDFILDEPCGQDVLPEEWEVDEDGNSLVVERAFEELEEAEKVAPVIHAHWEKGEKFPFLKHCSACGYEPPDNETADTYSNTWLTDEFKICPICGAHMFEEDEK